MRINRDQRLRPKAPARVNRINLVSDVLGADLRERTSKARVVRNERAIQIKDIHEGYCSSRSWSVRGTRPDIVMGRLPARQDGGPYRLERVVKR